MAAPKKAAAKKPAKRTAKKKATNGYDPKELELQALEEITKRKLVFADEVISYLPCSEKTYYNHKLQELQSIKEALTKNKIDIKGGLRQKWYKSDNATTDIALYKLIGTDEEAHRLNGTKTEQSITVKDPQAFRQLFGLDE